MRDDYLNRSWADHHGKLSDAIDKFFRDFMVSMKRLNAQEYDAPWQSAAERKRRWAK